MLLEISSSDVIKLSLIIYPSSSVVLGLHRHSTDDSRRFFVFLASIYMYSFTEKICHHMQCTAKFPIINPGLIFL